MISNAGLPVAHLGGEPAPALRTEGIVKPQGLRHIGNAVPRDGPVGNVEVDLLRPHIENILGVVGAPFRFGGAHELVGLENDVADAAPAHPGVFPAPGVDPVHHHAGHRLHSRIPFPARLALDQPRQQLPVRISHRSSSPVAFGPRFCFAGPFYADCGRQVLFPSQQQRKNRNGKSRSGSYAVTNGCLLLRHGRFQSAGKLVGAGGASAAAVDALQAGNGLLGLHALHQSGDALEVAVAAAYHLKITDHALIVYLYRHGPGADAPGLECICHIVLPSFLIRLENRITQFFLSAKPGF